MKTPLLLVGLLLLALLLALALPGVHRGAGSSASRQQALHRARQPLRVVRPPAVAQQHRTVRRIMNYKL